MLNYLENFKFHLNRFFHSNIFIWWRTNAWSISNKCYGRIDSFKAFKIEQWVQYIPWDKIEHRLKLAQSKFLSWTLLDHLPIEKVWYSLICNQLNNLVIKLESVKQYPIIRQVTLKYLEPFTLTSYFIWINSSEG